MAKRGADEGVGGEPPPKKVQFEQIKIGPVSTLEEIDMKTLHFQNKKLAEVRQPVVEMLFHCMWILESCFV